MRTVITPTFVVARTATRRPSLQHVQRHGTNETLCGLDMSGWSRSFSKTPIREILCMRCAGRLIKDGRYDSTPIAQNKE